MTYNEFISGRTIYPSYNKAKAKGIEAHHIIPQKVQKEKGIIDDRCVRLTSAEHAYAHILYDRENNIDSSDLFLKALNLKDRDINSITLEDCLPYDNLMKVAREQSIEKSTAYYSVPENRQHLSEIKIDYFSVPENRQKTSVATKIGMADPEVRQHLSETSTAYYSIPENRQHQSEVQTARFAIPENRQKTSEATRIGMADPEVRQHLSDVHTGKKQPPESKQKNSDSHKKIQQQLVYEYRNNNPDKLPWNEFQSKYFKQKRLSFQET